MDEFKVNIESDKAEGDVVSYTLREIPPYVHAMIGAFQREIGYKRNKKYNLEQTYVEALKDWAESRKNLQPI